MSPQPENTRFGQTPLNNPSQSQQNKPSYSDPTNPIFAFGQPPQQQPSNTLYPQIPPMPQYPQYPQYPNLPPQQQYPQYPQYPQPGQQQPAPGQYPFGQIPSFYFTTTTEPSLLHQFLYNKRGKPNSGRSSNKFNNLTTFLIVFLFGSIFQLNGMQH